MSDAPWLRTGIGAADADSITLMGRDLAGELMGRTTGRELPINGAGVGGAALADLGFPPALLRGLALLARTAGLLGHLAEEMERPLGLPLYLEVDERAEYDPPPR